MQNLQKTQVAYFKGVDEHNQKLSRYIKASERRKNARTTNRHSKANFLNQARDSQPAVRRVVDKLIVDKVVAKDLHGKRNSHIVH